QWEKNLIDKNYPGFKDKTQAWPQEVILNSQPFSLEEKELIKEQYAGGNEFFIYSGLIGSERNLMNLLKAFSAFKKRQKSGMRLIIAGNKASDFDTFSKELKNYRFKNEVEILAFLSSKESLQLIGASYAIVFPTNAEMSAITALQAMDLRVPVLATMESVFQEICGEAGLYFSSLDFKSIAEKMMLIFKDENLKKELCKKGKEMAQQYQPTDNSHQLLQLIENATKKIASKN
ncbi:MAG: glycosyltransferase, partial [Ginsengibacter sp.]